MSAGSWLRRPMGLGAVLFVLVTVVVSCLAPDTGAGARHRWWAGLGPVLPHDTFPADCTLCHKGSTWNELVPGFVFDHLTRTGVALNGAHSQAQCLLCHNDRGPVEGFAVQGCAGCHEDVHQAELGPNCASCHTESSWFGASLSSGMIERHNQTRFPLVGAHAAVSCQRCHPGMRQGNLLPANPDCLSCHSDDLARTANPPHQGLGWVDNCQQCHSPTAWSQARVR